MRLAGLAAIIALAACGQETRVSPDASVPSMQFDRATADKVQHGKRLAAVLGCVGCHGADLTGEDWSEPGFGKMWTANLSRAVPSYSDAQLARVIASGTTADRELWEMPSHLFTELSGDDMAALVAFLRIVPPSGRAHPAPAFEASIKQEIAEGTYKSSKTHVAELGKVWPPDAGPDLALGRYIVRATCAECHRMDLRGGEPYPGAQKRPDLRMVAAYDRQQFLTFMRTGKAAGNRELKLMSDVARGRYAKFTETEIDAVRAYLQQVAATDP